MNTNKKNNCKFNVKKSMTRVSNNVLNNMVFVSLIGVVLS